jgi:hypothetical protein
MESLDRARLDKLNKELQENQDLKNMTRRRLVKRVKMYHAQEA